MKAELLLILLVVIIVTPNAYGQEAKNFGYKLLPEKLVEGTEGILQVYGIQKNIPLPDPIENLIVTSSDQSIVKVLELNTNVDTAITSVKLQAMDSGTAKIAIAAPGYASEEFEIKIYDIKQGEQQLLVKTVPDTFTVNGPTKGYYSVQLADIDSNPTFAKQDTLISLSTSNDEIVTIFQNEIVINEGDYYAIGEFQVNKPGEVSIYAESPNTDPDSSKITVLGATDEDDGEWQALVHHGRQEAAHASRGRRVHPWTKVDRNADGMTSEMDNSEIFMLLESLDQFRAEVNEDVRTSEYLPAR